jgi:hypothetical protein
MPRFRKQFILTVQLYDIFFGLWESFDRILMVRKQRFNMSKFTIYLQFRSTKWAKAYSLYYILGKLQESMDNMVLCSLSWIM